MQEALKAIIEFAHTEMETEKIYAHISEDNQASIKLTKKLGLKIQENSILKNSMELNIYCCNGLYNV